MQSPGVTHAQETAAMALFGATKDATIGNATIEASPIFLITSRRDLPAKLALTSPSKREFSFS
jgi:hypothetical protein